MNQRRVFLFLALVAATLVTGAWLLRRGWSESAVVYQKAQRFDDIIARVSDFYVDSLDEAALYDMAIDGMLLELGDPYTGFLRPDDLADLRETTRGDYGGLGVRIEITNGWITVITPLSGTPAEEAGIQSGDRIVEVDGESTRGWSADRAVSALRGDPGSTVDIEVARAGLRSRLRFTIPRAQVHVTAVRYADFVAPEIGYVHLETVSERSASEVEAEVTRLRDAGARALVLDLRYNPGGLLDQGVAVTDLFLAAGMPVVRTQGRLRATSATFSADLPERWEGMPLAVLVNEYSASAAEIIAGALQDHDRALLLGTTTFGKGLVQTIFQVSSTEALRLTTSRWYTPSGRSIHRNRRTGATAGAPRVEQDGDILPNPEFRTQGGRVVVGGGGIHPDVVVRADTLTTGERTFYRVLGSRLQAFRDVIDAYARELKEEGISPEPASFAVMSPMRDELLRRLRDRGVTMPATVWIGAQPAVDVALRQRVLRYVFGRDTETQFQLADDPVVRAAIELLQQADTQEQLFTAAMGNAPER
ncbi:MAG: S41 family peptidase [Gemmatimonadetes bacterium]|nr:S41 family peptidase [Gemmatimonadota bacterium]